MPSNSAFGFQNRRVAFTSLAPSLLDIAPLATQVAKFFALHELTSYYSISAKEVSRNLQVLLGPT